MRIRYPHRAGRLSAPGPRPGYLEDAAGGCWKIDGQFIRELGRDALDPATVRVPAIAQVVGMTTVVEFVEAPGVLEQLRELVSTRPGLAPHRPEPCQPLCCLPMSPDAQAPQGLLPSFMLQVFESSHRCPIPSAPTKHVAHATRLGTIQGYKAKERGLRRPSIWRRCCLLLLACDRSIHHLLAQARGLQHRAGGVDVGRAVNWAPSRRAG